MFPFPLCRRDEEKEKDGARARARGGWKTRERKKGKQQRGFGVLRGGGMSPGISKVRDHFAFGWYFLPFLRATKYKERARGRKTRRGDRWWWRGDATPRAGECVCVSVCAGTTMWLCGRGCRSTPGQTKIRFLQRGAMAFADHNVRAVWPRNYAIELAVDHIIR